MKPDKSRVVYDGKQIDLVVERWGGSEREIVRHPGATAIVAVDGDNCVTLVRQLREPARAHLLELPAGTLEEGEESLASAQRELAEETGLHGGSWTELASFYSTPGFCTERVTVFLAEELEQGDAAAEDDEEIELVRWPAHEVESRLGEIEDAKTLVGLLLFVERNRARA
ncbi:MAG: ADP-ribose pyrophosphatase [Gaiellaceae bacterium]|nr:ADP-ribose pyrophosphatase [Gaiellaceae bacterium]